MNFLVGDRIRIGRQTGRRSLRQGYGEIIKIFLPGDIMTPANISMYAGLSRGHKYYKGFRKPRKVVTYIIQREGEGNESIVIIPERFMEAFCSKV